MSKLSLRQLNFMNSASAPQPLRIVKTSAEHAPARICLWFSKRESDGGFELTRSLFIYTPLNYSIQAVRGRYSGAYPGAATFQWTSAVQALSVAVLRAAAWRNREKGVAPLLSGKKGTLASSLDDALYKQTGWLCDVFGADVKGQSLANRLFKRTNPGKKQPGPVSFSLNGNVLPAHAITILIDETEVRESGRLEWLADLIEEEWHNHKAAKRAKESAGEDADAGHPVFPRQDLKSIIFISPAMESKPFYADVLERLIIGAGKIRTSTYVTIPKLPSRSFDSVELWSIFDQIAKGHVNADGVIIIPVDPDHHHHQLLDFYSKGRTPIVLFDVDMKRSDLKDTRLPPFVGGDERKGGRLAAQLFIDYFEEQQVKKPSMLILKGSSTTWESNRCESFREELRMHFPEVKINETEDLHYDRQKAREAALKAFRRAGGKGNVALDGVFACNDDMALGVRSAIIHAGREGLKFRDHMKIVGYDGVKEMRDYIDNHDRWILGTIDVRLEEQMNLCLRMMQRMIEENQWDLQSELVEPAAYRA